jgi:hypothetical protein
MKLDYAGSIDPSQGKEHIGLRVIAGKQPGTSVFLRPGCNTIAAKDWAKISDHATVKHLMETGQLTILEDDSDPKKSPPAFDISKRPPHQAGDLIRRTTEPDTLREWIAQVETAPNPGNWTHVLDALRKQLVEVTTDADGNPAEQRRLEMIA